MLVMSLLVRFRVMGITNHLQSGGTLDKAQKVAVRKSAKMTHLCDRTNDDVIMDEFERIAFPTLIDELPPTGGVSPGALPGVRLHEGVARSIRGKVLELAREPFSPKPRTQLDHASMVAAPQPAAAPTRAWLLVRRAFLERRQVRELQGGSPIRDPEEGSEMLTQAVFAVFELAVGQGPVLHEMAVSVEVRDNELLD